MAEAFIPNSSGTKADLHSQVDISRVYGGYFSSDDAVNEFIKIGIEPIVSKLPHKVVYADFGGGTGFMAQKIKEFIEKSGRSVECYVVDANAEYLQKAEALGLKIILWNLDIPTVLQYDLITMRSVLHYNNVSQQEKIIQNIWTCLGDGGYFINQNLSGNDWLCELKSKIVSIPELGRTTAGNHHWISETEYQRYMEKSGFKDYYLAGYAMPLGWTPEEQWERFNKGDVSPRRNIFLEKAYVLIHEYGEKHGYEAVGIYKQKEGTYKVVGTYPVYICRK